MATVKIMVKGEPGMDRPEDIGLAHLPGCGLLDFETACGRVGTFAQYEDRTNHPITCPHCLEQVRHILSCLSEAEIKKYRRR